MSAETLGMNVTRLENGGEFYYRVKSNLSADLKEMQDWCAEMGFSRIMPHLENNGYFRFNQESDATMFFMRYGVSSAI